MNRECVALLFIIFGLLTCLNTSDTTEEDWKNTYSRLDLLRGWGIYAVTIGMILMFPDNIKKILQLCFVVSILWHADITQCKGWNRHHYQAVYANLLALNLLI